MMNFLQGFVDNEINLNPDGSCSNSCSDYTKTKQFGCANGTMCADPKGLAKEDTTCSGDVRDCIDIGTDGDVLVNYAEHPHSALFAALTGGPSASMCIFIGHIFKVSRRINHFVFLCSIPL